MCQLNLYSLGKFTRVYSGYLLLNFEYASIELDASISSDMVFHE